MPRLTATHFNTREYQVQRKNHFEVQFNSQFVDKEMTFLVLSFPLPKETTESFDAPYFNQRVKLATQTTFDDTTLVLRDAIGYDTEKQFLNWRLRVYNPKTGEMGYAEDYKCEAKVVEYSPNGETGREWTLVGCWPAGIEYGDLSYEDGGEKQISVTIKYDYAYRNDI